LALLNLHSQPFLDTVTVIDSAFRGASIAQGVLRHAWPVLNWV